MISFNDIRVGVERETRWLTPPWIVDELGDFDLDPCGAPNHRLAKHTYLLEEGADGLRDPWFGRVWLNPPYGREAEPFMARMGEHGSGIALMSARTETRMFHEHVWPKASALFFLKGRVKFWTSDLKEADSANAPSVLIAYGESDAEVLFRANLPGAFVTLGK
jgi:hypothetical protein